MRGTNFRKERCAARSVQTVTRFRESFALRRRNPLKHYELGPKPNRWFQNEVSRQSVIVTRKQTAGRRQNRRRSERIEIREAPPRYRVGLLFQEFIPIQCGKRRIQRVRFYGSHWGGRRTGESIVAFRPLGDCRRRVPIRDTWKGSK